MNIVVKECIFLAFFCFSLGAFGAVTEPFIENTVALAEGIINALFCNSSLSPMNFTWSMWPVGDQRMRPIASGNLVVDPEMYYTSVEDVGGGNLSILTINFANVSTAGVYTCDEGQKQSAQVIIITEESTCNINPKPNEKRSSDEISQLSCTMKYAANESYVVANMKWVKWPIYGSSESLKSSMETSTSANITTATSTLNITRSEDIKCVSIYICTTTFSLAANLPSGFATNQPEYTKACSPNVDACEKYEPTCNFALEPNEALPSNEILRLSCILKYVANSFYVFSGMKWSIDGSLLSLDSSMENSTSANITTATSTIRRKNYWCGSIYRCTTTFNVTDKLPIGFERPAGYARSCSLNISNSDACKDEKPTKPTREPLTKPTREPSRKPPSTNSVQKSGGNSDEESGETPGVTPGKNAGVLSVGSSKRNIVIRCVVGIAGFLLIGTGTGV